MQNPSSASNFAYAYPFSMVWSVIYLSVVCHIYVKPLDGFRYYSADTVRWV